MAKVSVTLNEVLPVAGNNEKAAFTKSGGRFVFFGGAIMRQPNGFHEYGKKGCCPTEWNNTPCMTGDYVFDGSIQRCRNSDMHKKIRSHIAGAYDINSAYKRSPRD